MGQTQSQEIDRFISDNINTTAIASVISNYSTRTNATVVNTQDLCVNIVATGDIDFGSGFSAIQRIDSMINVETLIDRVDKDSITNDLQRSISNELKESLSSIGTTGIWNIPSNQRIRDDIITNINTYVSQVINTNTLDEVLLSSSNVQNGCYTFQATNVRGPIVITQEIQATTMADNMVKQVLERALENRDIQLVDTSISTDVQGVGDSGSGGIGSLLFYIAAAIVIVLSIVVAYLVPLGIKPRVAIVTLGVITGIVLVVIGIVKGRASTTTYNKVSKGKRVKIA